MISDSPVGSLLLNYLARVDPVELEPTTYGSKISAPYMVSIGP